MTRSVARILEEEQMTRSERMSSAFTSWDEVAQECDRLSNRLAEMLARFPHTGTPPPEEVPRLIYRAQRTLERVRGRFALRAIRKTKRARRDAVAQLRRNGKPELNGLLPAHLQLGPSGDPR